MSSGTRENRQVGQTTLEVPVLGCGCAAIGNLYQRVEEETAQAMLAAAWDHQVRFFDTAPYYGHGLSETRLGEFLAGKPREQFKLSTKVGRALVPADRAEVPHHGFVDPLPFAPVFDYSFDGVRAQVDDSRQRLGIDAFDILFVHDLGILTHGNRHQAILDEALGGAFVALQQLKAAGEVTAIGLGVNEIAVCLEVLRRVDLDVILLAGRYTLLEQDALSSLLPQCVDRDTSVVIGGPFNSGLLAGDDHYDYNDVPGEIALRRDALRTISERHNVALPAAALQFPLGHPAVISVIPGMRSPVQVEENAAWFDTPVPGALWRDLRAAGLIRAEAPVPV